MNIKVFLSSLCIGLSTVINAQTIDVEKLDNYFNTLEKNDKMMGSIAISSNNKIIYQKAFGFSDVENGVKANTNTKYKIGSISKTFTAVLTFKAIEQNKLSLDTKLDKFFPTVKNANKITVRNLLNHSSGVYSITDDETYLSWNTIPMTEKELLDKIDLGDANFEPNTKNEYSNSNYVLLTLILQKIHKQPYAEILKKQIVDPLNLTSTYLGENKNSDTNIATSYVYKNEWTKESETHFSIPLGAGAIVSTPKDLTVFINALFGGKIIKPESLKEMTTFTEHYGLGLFDLPFKTHKAIGHDGAIDGFKSMLTVFPDEKISYALVTNASNYQLDLVTQTVQNAIFNYDYVVPEFKQISFTEDELNKFSGTYSNDKLPFKLTIFQKDLKLFAQATGQQALPLEATEKNVFTFDKAGIKLSFSTKNKTVALEQGGQKFDLIKE